MKTNPIIKTDYPDPDVIRAGDTYYMLSSTMYFTPGGAILRSYDLIHWEIAAYVFEILEDTPGQRMEGEWNNYGNGMWSGSLRCHQGSFYVCFGVHGADCTHIYRAGQVEGPWERISVLKGYFHHPSLFFDEDGRNYIISGSNTIWLGELTEDLTRLKPGGTSRILAEDREEGYVGYDGSHFYRINGKYYLFVNNWPRAEPARRTQYCFRADSLEGEFTGKMVLCDDRGYFNQGVAQGGLVQALDGKWYAVLYQDHGAVGRIPVLVPVAWKDGFPVYGRNGRVPANMTITGSRPYYPYEPLYTSDDFQYGLEKEGTCRLKPQWQWNHNSNPKYWSILPEGGLRLRTNKICTNVTQAVNTLTQRMMWPGSTAEVLVDASGIREGEMAGICALQGCYGLLAITRELNQFYLVMMVRELKDRSGNWGSDYMPGTVLDKVEIPGSKVRLLASANFGNMEDTAEFFYESDGKWKKIGRKHSLFFRLDHFTGCRYGLFHYATKEPGGEAIFRNFRYHYVQ